MEALKGITTLCPLIEPLPMRLEEHGLDAQSLADHVARHLTRAGVPWVAGADFARKPHHALLAIRLDATATKPADLFAVDILFRIQQPYWLRDNPTIEGLGAVLAFNRLFLSFREELTVKILEELDLGLVQTAAAYHEANGGQLA